MGSIGTFFAATLVAVTYGWMPASSGEKGEPVTESSGYEYLVQIDAEDLRALAEGRVASLSSATPEELKSIDRVRIVFGKSELPRQLTAVDRTSPKRIAKQGETAVKHTVAKPIVSDWLPARNEEAGSRHTVYQSPGYQNPGNMGETMQQGSKPLTDAIRNAPQDFGNYINQTARDFSQGTRDVVDGTNTGTQQPGFTAFSYNQSQPASQNDSRTQVGNTRANVQDSHAGHNHQTNTSLDQQPFDNRGQGPTLPTVTGRTAADNGIATTFGAGTGANSQSNDQGFRRNNVDNGNGDFRDTYRNDYRDYERSNDTGTYSNREQFVDQRDRGSMTPVARDAAVERGPIDEFSNRRDDAYRNPSRSGSDWGPQTVDNRRSTATDFGSSDNNAWGTPPLTPQQPRTQTTGFGTNPNQGTSSDASSWGSNTANNNVPNYNQNNPQNDGFADNSQNNGINNGGQQTASFGNDLWFSVFLAISVFGNLYVVTSYLDVRNKYRSALRQGPRGYQHAG